MSNPNLIPYRVMLHEEKGDKFQIAFDCQAESDDHAVEQAENAYPNGEIVSYLPFDHGDTDLSIDSWLRTLAPGDEVWWNDPHCGISSGIYKVSEINAGGGAVTATDIVLQLKNEAGSEAEVFASEVSPSQPEELYPVVDGDDGNGDIYGYARTKDEAMEVGNQTFADEVVDGYLAENVTLRDGTTVPKAWVALTHVIATPVRLRLTFDIEYAPNGESIEDLTERLRRTAERAINEGLLTGDSPATVEQYAMDVVETQEPPTEDETADFMLQRIENGQLGVEDIPLRLARYGLMESHQFVAEMRERMTMTS